MNQSDFRARLRLWQQLGPFRTTDDLRREMLETANALSGGDAPMIADTLIALDQEAAQSLLDALLSFLEIYTPMYHRDLGAALLARLGPAGPPVLVEQLGPTHHPDAVRRLRETVDLSPASDDLLIALASTLGELRDTGAKTLLRSLADRPNQSPAVQNEIRIALAAHARSG